VNKPEVVWWQNYIRSVVSKVSETKVYAAYLKPIVKSIILKKNFLK